MITENEREYLLEAMEGLLDKYDYSYSRSALDKIIDEWSAQKAPLIEAFKKHPNYVPSKFMIALEGNYNRDIDPHVAYEFSTWIQNNCVMQMKDKIPEEFSRGYSWCGNLNDGLYNLFVYDLGCYTSQHIDEALATRVNALMPSLHAREGQKTSKVIGKMLRYLGYDQVDGYNREFAKYADSLNPLVVTRRTVLSINPLDYLTMSFGNSWASCHTIDKHNKRNMPNSYSGCYSSGTVSYMLDPSSMVLYTVDTSYKGDDYWTQDKINRQMFHWGGNKLVQSRLYPQANDSNGEAYTPYRNIVQNIMSVIFEFDNFWTVKKGISAASRYISSDGTHYEDYRNFRACTLSVVKGMENEDTIFVGARPICIECGYRHSNEESINCCRGNHIYCECCEDPIDTEDEDYVEIGGYYYHTDCVNYCNCCDEYTTDNTRYVEGYGYICDSCLDDDFVWCNEHNGYARDTDVEYVNSTGVNVCESCLDRYYDRCEECEEYFYADEIVTNINGRCTCRSCRSRASE